MALIRFRRPEEATEFVEAYNGKPFNSMDVSTLPTPLWLTVSSLLLARDLPCCTHFIC